MKKLITAIAITAALSAPVYAGSDHKEGKHGINKSSSQVQMHDHVQMMQNLMADIKREKDPAKRHQMMQKHMKSMQQGVHMMGNGGMSSVKLETRVGMVEERMNMMQQMMLQMMEYSSQAQDEDSAFRKSITEGGFDR